MVNIKKIFDLTDKVIVLTGSSGLLGEQYAEGLCQCGATLALADKNFQKTQEIAKRLESKYNCQIFPIKLDLTNKKSIVNSVSNIFKKFGKIDVLINNAMYHEGENEQNASFENFPLSSWEKVISVNITGMFLMCQEIGKIMKKQKSGVIINISSIYGMVGADQRIYGKSNINSTAAYATTKSAILNFSRYLASYFHKDGIRVNTLSLGGVSNNQDSAFRKNYSKRTMIGRMAKKDEYVGGIIFLASDASSYMTGSNLIIDGGWTAW